MAFFNETTQNARISLAKQINEGKRKLNSSIIKALLFDYFRFNKGMLGALSEVRVSKNTYEDFVAFKKDEVVCVEIKISKSDFVQDFKKTKFALKEMNCHKFYYCVPMTLKDFVISYLKEHNKTQFGVLVCDEYLNIITARKAHYLREKCNIFKDDEKAWVKGNFVMENLAYRLIQRMSCELATNWVLRLDDESKRKENK